MTRTSSRYAATWPRRGPQSRRDCRASAAVPFVRNTRDGDPHEPAQLVMQFWVDRTTGPGITVTSSQIMDDGTIDVGVSGDLRAAKAALNNEFPGFITVHHQEAGVPL